MTKRQEMGVDSVVRCVFVVSVLRLSVDVGIEVVLVVESEGNRVRLC